MKEYDADPEEQKNLSENVQEVIPEVSAVELTRRINTLKKSEKELAKLANIRVIEEKKYHKRKMKNKLTKAAKKRNRKNK